MHAPLTKNRRQISGRSRRSNESVLLDVVAGASIRGFTLIYSQCNALVRHMPELVVVSMHAAGEKS